MKLTEEQLEEARAEIERREDAKAKAYHDEYMRKVREDDERFHAKMKAQYPNLSEDDMYDIYSQYSDYYQ